MYWGFGGRGMFLAQLKLNRMEKEIEKLIEFITNPKHLQDSESEDYLSDGEMLDIVLDKLKELINKNK